MIAMWHLPCGGTAFVRPDGSASFFCFVDGVYIDIDGLTFDGDTFASHGERFDWTCRPI